MKKFFNKRMIGQFVLGVFLISFKNVCLAQCKEMQSESTKQTVRYQTISLTGQKEYLMLSSVGEERLLSYHNEVLDLVFHAPMFTEIKFTSTKGNFSVFSTAMNRTRWKRCFVLSAPLTPRELEKLKGIVKIEIMLPEDHRTFSLNTEKSDKLEKALACLL